MKEKEEVNELKLEELEKKLEECEKLKGEYLASWQRERADFLNYKKDEEKRAEDIAKYCNENLVLRILPILDNFEVAIKEGREFHSPEEIAERMNPVIEGYWQIMFQLKDFLKSEGVEEIISQGAKFDPNLHEVIEEIEKKDSEPGTIVEEIQKGYTINGRLLRPAKVKVSK